MPKKQPPSRAKTKSEIPSDEIQSGGPVKYAAQDSDQDEVAHFERWVELPYKTSYWEQVLNFLGGFASLAFAILMIGGFTGFVITIYTGDEKTFKEWYWWLVMPIFAGIGLASLVFALKSVVALVKKGVFDGVFDNLTESALYPRGVSFTPHTPYYIFHKGNKQWEVHPMFFNMNRFAYILDVGIYEKFHHPFKKFQYASDFDIESFLQYIHSNGYRMRFAYRAGLNEVTAIWVLMPGHQTAEKSIEPENIESLQESREIREEKTLLRKLIFDPLKDNPFRWMRRSVVSIFLVLITLLMLFAGLINNNFSDNPLKEIMPGIFYDPLFARGQYWRILTGIVNFIQPADAIFIVILLLTSGALIEQNMRSWRYAMVYLLTAVSGMLLAAWMKPFSTHIGAYAGIFGVMTYWFIITLIKPKIYVNLAAKLWHVIPVPFTVLFVIAFIMYGVREWAVVVGGLLSGLALALLTTAIQGTEQLLLRIRKELMLFALIITMLSLIVFNFPQDRYYYFKMVNYFNNTLNSSNEIVPQSGFLYSFPDFVKIYKNDISLWEECHDSLSKFSFSSEPMNLDLQKLKRYSNKRIMSDRYHILVYNNYEYEYLDSIENINLSLPGLKYLPIVVNKKANSESHDKIAIKKTRYFNEALDEVPETAAAYKMVAVEDSLGNLNGHVDEFLKLEGYNKYRLLRCGNYSNGLQQGIFKEYHSDNGRLKSIGYYGDNKPLDRWKYYFSDGQLDEVVEYRNDTTFVIESYDVDGDTLIFNGEGVIRVLHENGIPGDSGRYLGGLKEGDWVGYYVTGHRYYKERYESGKLIFGMSLSPQGETYYYEKTEQQAVSADPVKYKQYLAGQMRYPEQAKAKGIEGVVLVNAYIDEAGEIRYAYSINRLGFGMEEEAVRLVKEGPRFLPASKRGQSVEDEVIIEVAFYLN